MLNSKWQRHPLRCSCITKSMYKPCKLFCRKITLHNNLHKKRVLYEEAFLVFIALIVEIQLSGLFSE